jgi:transposase
MKSILIQYGVRNFNPKLRKAAEKINAVQPPEGAPLQPNAASALRRHMERFRLINEQIKAIERTRAQLGLVRAGLFYRYTNRYTERTVKSLSA